MCGIFVTMNSSLRNRSCSFKVRGSSAKVIVKPLSDDDSYNEEDNISENGGRERHLFSSDSK